MNILTVILALFVFAIVMGLMAIGVMFRGKCLRGSCGGEGAVGPDGELLTCDTCPRRKEREHEATGENHAHAADAGRPELSSH